MKKKLDELRFELCVWLLKPYFPYINIYQKRGKVVGITFTRSKKYCEEIDKIK
jgi:hypothetical protein